MSIFGTLIDGAQLEDDLRDHLDKWLPTHLAQLAEDRGLPRGSWLRPDGKAVGSWVNSASFEVTEGTTMPIVIIINTGIDGVPVRYGDGSYDAAWIVGIGGMVSAGGDDTRRNSRRLAQRFGAAVRQTILQHQGIGVTYIESTEWLDEAYDDLDPSMAQSTGSFRLVFRFVCRGVDNDLNGPVTPDPLPDPVTNPYPDWGTVGDINHIHVDVEKEPLP